VQVVRDSFTTVWPPTLTTRVPSQLPVDVIDPVKLPFTARPFVVVPEQVSVPEADRACRSVFRSALQFGPADMAMPASVSDVRIACSVAVSNADSRASSAWPLGVGVARVGDGCPVAPLGAAVEGAGDDEAGAAEGDGEVEEDA